jgi:CheY-like chemotaxis protein
MTNPVHILIVQDDAIDAEIVVHTFQDEEMDNPFTIAPTGREALSILRGEGGYERLPRPYIILLDIKLPGMDGLDFLQMVRDDPDLKRSIIFMLTGSDRDKDKAAAYDRQVAGYILNPDINKLRDLAAMLKYYLQIVEFPSEKSGY